MSGPSSVADPLCIILVKNGSKGDRLLFRYPYRSSTPNQSPNRNSNKDTFFVNPIINGHSSLSLSPEKSGSGGDREGQGPSSGVLDSSSEWSPNSGSGGGGGGGITTANTSGSGGGTGTGDSSQSQHDSTAGPSRKISRTGHHPHRGIFQQEKAAGSDDLRRDQYDADKALPADGKEMLRELSDKDLSNLLAVGAELSERKFELKLNYLRFVGHPTLMQDPNSYRSFMAQSSDSSIKLFHIVFCLNAVASHAIVKCFHDLSKRLGIALRHEEHRCGYVTEEFRSIIYLHDEVCAAEHLEEHDEETEAQTRLNMFDEILSKSSLAKLLKQVYEDVVEAGRTFVRVNGWIQISFCLPQKIHKLKFREEKASTMVDPETIHKCLEGIRPYHAILLLMDPDDLADSLLLDASSNIARLLQVYSPLKSLQTMAADADLTLSHVMEIASHLVYWAQASIIYPLCESNVYVIAPDVPITSKELKEEFEEEFRGLSLSQVLADFSSPMPLGERINPILDGHYAQAQQIQLVTWLLKYRLIIHLHTYIYLTTYFDGTNDMGFGAWSLSTPNIPDVFNMKAFEWDENEVTASDSFSDNAMDDINNGSMGDHDTSLEKRQPESLSSQTGADIISNDALEGAFPQLSEAVKRAISIVKTPLSVQDIKTFSRLSKYFTGDFHLEEVMYRENVRRSQLMLLLDKFRDVLVTIEKEDPEINFFQLS